MVRGFPRRGGVLRATASNRHARDPHAGRTQQLRRLTGQSAAPSGRSMLIAVNRHSQGDYVQESEGGVLKNTGWLLKPPEVFALPTHCTLMCEVSLGLERGRNPIAPEQLALMGDPCAQPGLKPCTGPRARRRAVAGSLIRATPSTASGPNGSGYRSSTGRDRTTSEAAAPDGSH